MTANTSIEDLSTADQKVYQLFVDNAPKAKLTKIRGVVQLTWQVYGPQNWPQAKALVQGLLELSVLADQLSGEKE